MNKKIYILLLLSASILCFSYVLFAAEDKLKSSEDKLKSAEGYLKRRDYQHARQLYKEVFLVAKDPKVSEKSLWGLVRCDFRLKRYFEVRLNVKRLFDTYPLTEYLNEAYLLLGYMSMDSNQLREAAEYFRRIKGPLEDKASIGRAELALKDGDFLRAETLLSGIQRKLFDYDPRALYVRAVIFSRKNMPRESVAAVNRIFEADLKEEGLRTAKAEIYMKAGKLKEAETQLNRIVSAPASRNEGLEAKRVLFDVYDRQGRTDEALKITRDLMTYDAPEDFKMRVIGLYDKKGALDDAIRFLVYVKDKAKRNLEIEKRLRSAMSADDPRAVEYLRKYTLYLGPDNPFLVEASGFLLKKGKKLEAEMFLRSAEKGASKGAADLLHAEQFVEEGKYDQALKLLTPLADDKKYGAEASTLLADVLSRRGNYPSAIEYLKKAVAAAETPKALVFLGDLYWKTGDRKNSLNCYVSAAGKGNGYAAVKAGDIYFMEGDGKKAASFYESGLKAAGLDNRTVQWAEYQYGKLTNNKEYLRKSAGGGGDIAEAAAILLEGR